MKIKKSILKKINTVRQRMSIADKLGCGEQALAVQLRINKSDGRLTKMDALQAISQELGVDIGEILEKEPSKAIN